MKRKKPKNKPIDTWRDVKLRLPANFVKGLSDVRDEDGNAYSLPVARGNAIMNRLGYALRVAEELGQRVQALRGQIVRAAELIKKLEERLERNEVNYEDLKKEYGAEGIKAANSADSDERGDGGSA
tara:strand:+ start:348 stop:725 length:378 start_codon:yes stop_codon:yes gene_type:complete